MRHDVAFNTTDGTTLRGWHYKPQGATGPAPVIVMSHGFSAVKEIYLDKYADHFAASGLGCLVYDNRNFGASGGEPRQEIDPWQQVRDYSDAITYAQTLPGADPSRIGIWGSSYSGGHVLVVGAIDRRVGAVVAQVPLVSGYHGFRRLVRADYIAPTFGQFADDRASRAAGAAPGMIAVVSNDPAVPAALATAESFEFFTKVQNRAPSWRNEVTLRTLEYGFGYEPGAYIGLITPTPLLMLVALDDSLTVTDLSVKAFSDAHEPKKLVLLPGRHFDAYVDGFTESSGPALAWFKQHLA